AVVPEIWVPLRNGQAARLRIHPRVRVFKYMVVLESTFDACPILRIKGELASGAFQVSWIAPMGFSAGTAFRTYVSGRIIVVLIHLPRHERSKYMAVRVFVTTMCPRVVRVGVIGLHDGTLSERSASDLTA